MKVFRFTDEDLKMIHSLLVDKTNDWEIMVKTGSDEVYEFLKAINVEPDDVELKTYYYTKQ